MELTQRARRLHRIRKIVPATENAVPRQPLAAIAQQMLEQARRRTQFVPGAIFEDPQWLMTLDLFIAGEEGRQVSVSSLCCASGVPPTTALRHIRHLQAQGIVERFSHPNDRRISLVQLAEASRGQVARYLISLVPNLMTGGKHSASSANV